MGHPYEIRSGPGLTAVARVSCQNVQRCTPRSLPERLAQCSTPCRRPVRQVHGPPRPRRPGTRLRPRAPRPPAQRGRSWPQLMTTALTRLPGHRAMLEFATSIDAPFPSGHARSPQASPERASTIRPNRCGSRNASFDPRVRPGQVLRGPDVAPSHHPTVLPATRFRDVLPAHGTYKRPERPARDGQTASSKSAAAMSTGWYCR